MLVEIKITCYLFCSFFGLWSSLAYFTRWIASFNRLLGHWLFFPGHDFELPWLTEIFKVISLCGNKEVFVFISLSPLSSTSSSKLTLPNLLNNQLAILLPKKPCFPVFFFCFSSASLALFKLMHPIPLRSSSFLQLVLKLVLSTHMVEAPIPV